MSDPGKYLLEDGSGDLLLESDRDTKTISDAFAPALTEGNPRVQSGAGLQVIIQIVTGRGAEGMRLKKRKRKGLSGLALDMD